MRIDSFLYSMVISVLFISCSKPEEGQKVSDLRSSGDTVFVSEKSPLLSKIKLLTVSHQEYNSQCITTGTVKPLSGRLAEVSSPFEGRILKSYVKLGEKITAGTPLFEVTSSDYLEAVKAFLQAKQSKILSEKNYQRKKDITENGIGSKKELEEAETDLKIAEEEYEKTKATLNIFHVKADDIDLSKQLIVRSPISGEVVKNDIVVGQYQKSDATPVITIADLDIVWVVARVKEKNIGQISPQDQVQVFTESMPEKPIRGFVDYIGNIMDEQTRSVEVYIECENHTKLLKSGMFVTASFEHKMVNAIIIPSTAVLQDGDKSFVYVQVGKNKFSKKQVVISSSGDENMIVKKGLESNDVIVAEGGIYLR